MRKELNNIINTINKIILVIIFSAIFLTLTACDEEVQPIKYSIEDYTIFPDEVKGIIKNKKIYITSIGQSNDMNNFELVISQNQNYFEYISDAMLGADEVENGSVILVFVGCSIKGLSESETNISEETKRAEEFARKCQQKNITMIAFHLGGPSRRGSTSDSLIKIVFENSDFNIFVESGNSDNYLTDISFENDVPCYQITSSLALEDPIKELLGLEE